MSIKISEMIEILNATQKVYGDIEVVLRNHDWKRGPSIIRDPRMIVETELNGLPETVLMLEAKDL